MNPLILPSRIPTPSLHKLRHLPLLSPTLKMSTCTLPSSNPKPHFSSSYTEEQGTKDLLPLLKTSGQGGRWSVIESGKGIERKFKFKGFKKCWEFMNTVAPECTVQKHHPEWSNVYNTTFIRWTTHSPPGLSPKDVLMAKFCDEAALKFGEVIEDVEEEGGLGKDLVDRVATEAGDCCVPKKKG